MITVFTPTYNRAYIIDKLYTSLKHQTNKNFEWIVIDDGSTDNTEELFKVWCHQEQSFPIIYEKTKNGGKHRAINKGLDMAQGKYFFIVDSDDFLPNDAIENVYSMFKEVAFDDNFCGVSGLKANIDGEMHGDTYALESHLDCYFYEREHYNIKGDKAEIFKTDILKQYKFPEFPGENFITESAVWYKMGYNRKIRYFNKIIYLGNYLDDGLSKNLANNYFNYPLGNAYANKILKKYGNLSFLKKLHIDYGYYYNFKPYYDVKNIKQWMKISPLRFWLIKLIYKIKKIS